MPICPDVNIELNLMDLSNHFLQLANAILITRGPTSYFLRNKTSWQLIYYGKNLGIACLIAPAMAKYSGNSKIV